MLSTARVTERNHLWGGTWVKSSWTSNISTGLLRNVTRAKAWSVFWTRLLCYCRRWWGVARVILPARSILEFRMMWSQFAENYTPIPGDTLVALKTGFTTWRRRSSATQTMMPSSMHDTGHTAHRWGVHLRNAAGVKPQLVQKWTWPISRVLSQYNMSDWADCPSAPISQRLA